MRTCTSCGRTIGKVAARCLYCGTPTGDAPIAVARKPVLGSCPGCLRNVRALPGATGACAFCALSFELAEDGATRPASSTPAVTHAHVHRLVSPLPAARLWDLVRDVLLRRAAFQELGAGEAERAVDALTLIATWPGESPQWLPIAIHEAPTVVPRAIFGVSDGGVVDEDEHTVLLSTIATMGRNKELAGRAASNLLGHASALGVSAVTSSLGLGFGVRYKPKDEVATESRLQLRAYLVARHGGVELETVLEQIDQEPPTPLSAAQERELHRRIAASRSLLAAYYILGALFGPSCKGGTAFSITRDAIAQRLTTLGCDGSPELIDQLVIRMPPAFTA